MGKVTIEYWECDCCRERFDKESSLRKTEVPARKYDRNGERFVSAFVPLDLCQECEKRLWQISDRFFATVEIGNGKVSVFPHDEKEYPVYRLLGKESEWN